MRHLLITISDLQSLTDAELNRLEATLRHILETALDLTDAERANLKASLDNIGLTQHLLHPVQSHYQI